MKKNLPLQYAATIREEHAAWVVRLAEARTKRHLRDGDADEAEEYKKKPVQLVEVLDEALGMGLHFMRLRDLGDDTAKSDAAVGDEGNRVAAPPAERGAVMKRTRDAPRSPLHLAPPPPEPTSMERFLKLVDEQDTRGRKIMLLTVMRMCDQFYREKGRAGWGGNIRALRKRIAEVEHELATVSHIH